MGVGSNSESMDPFSDVRVRCGCGFASLIAPFESVFSFSQIAFAVT